MSAAAAVAFLERAERDEVFAGELEELSADPDAVLARVQSEGFDVTPADVREALLDHYGAELTPEQLDAINAGMTDEEIGMVVAVPVLVVIAAAAF